MTTTTPTTPSLSPEQVAYLLTLAQTAGAAVMDVYAQPIEVIEKADASPVTQADMASHKILLGGLQAFSLKWPVLSEESSVVDYAERMQWRTYWLIDPLDGTKEFIKRNDEFTVNVALEHDNQAIFGVVYAPALGVLYWGGIGMGAFKQAGDGSKRPIKVRSRPKSVRDWVLVASRSHQSDELRRYLQQFEGATLVAAGSSLKLCLVAEGAADIYPRLGLTSEWDTAAAHAIVDAAGGQVLSVPDSQPLQYNTNAESLLNPHFIVYGQPL